MSDGEAKPKSMTETAMARFEAKQAELTVLKTYGSLTLAADGIGKVEEAHKAVKRAESEIEKDRVELKAPALEFGRLVDSKAKELQAILDPIEKHLKAQRDIHDAEKLKEKAAKEAAKAAALNERVSRLSVAGIPVTDIAVIGAMAADEFEFFFAKESRLAAEAKAETERLEALRAAELTRQAEELRVRAEEVERQRLADEAAMAEERARLKAEREAEEARQAEEREKHNAERAEQARLQEIERKANEERLRIEREAMEAERAEMRRQQEELQRHQQALREKAEAEAAEKRRIEKEAEIARREAAAAPELEKLEMVLQVIRDAAGKAVVNCGEPAWCVHLDEALTKLASDMRLVVRQGV